jgi:hypothetical protein
MKTNGRGRQEQDDAADPKLSLMAAFHASVFIPKGLEGVGRLQSQGDLAIRSQKTGLLIRLNRSGLAIRATMRASSTLIVGRIANPAESERIGNPRYDEGASSTLIGGRNLRSCLLSLNGQEVFGDLIGEFHF